MVNKEELITSFVAHNYKDLLSGRDIPPIKFIFNEEYLNKSKGM